MDDHVVLTAEEVAGLRPSTTPLAALTARVNGEAEARASLAAFTHIAVGELTDHAVATVTEIVALQRGLELLTERAVLGLRLLMEAVEELESRPTGVQKILASVTRAWARTRL